MGKWIDQIFGILLINLSALLYYSNGSIMLWSKIIWKWILLIRSNEENAQNFLVQGIGWCILSFQETLNNSKERHARGSSMIMRLGSVSWILSKTMRLCVHWFWTMIHLYTIAQIKRKRGRGKGKKKKMNYIWVSIRR